MANARIIPIIIKVSGGRDADAAVKQITSAFKQIKTEADNTAEGSANAFSQHFSASFFAGIARQAFNAFRQEATLFIKDSIQLAQELQNALLGVGSVAAFKGIDRQAATDAVNNLSIVKAGLIGVADASIALKNLLQAGFGLQQSVTLIERFGDSAAFGKQAALSYGEAVRSATEGIKNQNSILVDNAGVTKNISVILKERGHAMEDLSDKVKGASAREALYQGLLAETEAQLGDSAKLTDTYTGAIAAQDKAYQDLQRTIGNMIITNPKLIESNKIVTEQISATTDELMRQGSESQKLADSMISAWAEIKASILPFLAFLKNAVVAAVAAQTNVSSAAIFLVLKGTETLVDAVSNAITKVVNLGISGVNSVSAVARSLPGGSAFAAPELQPMAATKTDLGSAAFKAMLDGGAKQFRESIDKMSKSVDEGIEIRRRLADRAADDSYMRQLNKSLGLDASGHSSSAAADARLARANELTGQPGGGAGGSGSKAKLTDLQSFDRNAERATLKALYELGKQAGFIPGTNQSAAAHNAGSFHPLGRALDFSIRGKSAAEVEQFIAELRSAGYTVFDERQHPKGQKKWGGPHVHAQFNAGGLLTADPSQAMVFAPWSGKMITQADYNQQQAAFFRKSQGEAPLQAAEFDPDAVTLPGNMEREWSHFYDDMTKREDALAARREDWAAEYKATQRNLVTEIGNLEEDLYQTRLQNADAQFVADRQRLMVVGEEVDLTRELARVQDEIATGPYNEALRLQLAYYQAIHAVQMQNEADLVRNFQNQVQLAHQMDMNFDRLNDGVVEFLAQQKTLQQTFQDARTNTVRTFFDGIDLAIDKMTKSLGVAGEVLGQFLKDLAHLAASQLLQRLLGIGNQGQEAGAGGSNGGGGGFFGNLLGSVGSFFRPQGAAAATGNSFGLTGGYAGGPGAGGFFGAGNITGPGSAQRAALAGMFGGSGISVAPSLSGSGQFSPAQIAEMAQGNVASTAASATGIGGSLGAGIAGMAPLLPILGATLGIGLGGQSRTGQILGGLGGAASGVFGLSALAAFGVGGLSLTPLLALAGSVGLIAAPFLIAGAIIMAKNAARRRDERTRDAISNNTGQEIWKLIDEARSLGMAGSMARWNEIATNYKSQIAQIKDSKTRRHAEQQWTNDFLPLLDIVKKRAAEGDAAKAFSSNFFPTFASGGLVPYRSGGGLTMIGVRPGERIDDVGLRQSWTVPGRDRGYDSVLTVATAGSAVRTKAQQRRFPSFAGGSNTPLGASNGGGPGGAVVVQIPITLDAGGLVVRGVKTSDGRKAVVSAMHDDANINGRDGYIGTVEVALSQPI